ncbi:hypothetical protein [Pseudonocardia sp. GCM10023141]|uniref:hypothetical protein n=1 Tax=Pseudonocardia sp. GCM10023141 TaxID=3252653 RepID=UPI0036235A12
MSVRVMFEGGPADGVVQEYPLLDRALPSLYWHRDEPSELRGIYHLLNRDPDPDTGVWRYGFTSP